MKAKLLVSTSPISGISQAKKIKLAHRGKWKLRKVRDSSEEILVSDYRQAYGFPPFCLKEFRIGLGWNFATSKQEGLANPYSALNYKLWEGKNQVSKTLYMDHTS